ncbi:MAG: DUF835 domain-containing protein [Euryarchaeota archaeon]|nr:DUF835 domain-containing protein [Euryarchaeota archaeon]
MSRKKILVVDDEEFNLELITAYLSYNFDIITATSGNEALEKVRTEKPDMVLLDILMPGMNGFQVCEILKTNSETSFIPVVMVTALAESENLNQSIDAGADDFLTKPVDSQELIIRVNSLLRMKHLHDELVSERNTAQKYLDVAASILVVTDNDQEITLINKKGVQMLGYDEDEIVGKNLFDTLIPESSGKILKDIYSNLQKGGYEHIEYIDSPVICKGGEQRLVSLHISPLTDSEGNVTSILSSGEDVTEKKNAENEVRKVNEYMDHMIEISPIAIISLDMYQKLKSANKKAANLLGYPSSELAEMPISALIGDQKLDFADNKDIAMDFVKKDGNPIPLNVSTSVIKGKDMEKGLILTLQDISELRGLFIKPSPEEKRSVDTDIQELLDVKGGITYVFDDKEFNAGYDLFSKYMKAGYPGLCITRQNPQHIKNTYGLHKTPFVWLTRNKIPDQPSINPSELFKINPTIKHFVDNADRGIILIDGMEYLILENDLTSVLKLMEQNNDIIMASSSRLFLQIDPISMGQKEFHLAKRWMKKIPKKN